MDKPKQRFALLSVFDKTGIISFAQALTAQHYTLVATGGTSAVLTEHNIDHVDVATLTGVAPMLGGRVKTLHPIIHGGILARRNIDAAQITKFSLPAIDIVAVNLYPFAQAVANSCDHNVHIENIDIGGPTLLRAAAKNYADVLVLCDPSDYQLIDADVTEKTRCCCAAKAFNHVAVYDSNIAAYFNERAAPRMLPQLLHISKHSQQVLRYGENPQQQAQLYSTNDVLPYTQHCGKPLSYNNIIDMYAAMRICASIAAIPNACQAACVIVKHANPCGAALAATPQQAYDHAFAAEPQAAFGGIIAFYQPINAALVSHMLANQFIEVIIAPAISDCAVAAAAYKPNVRLVSLPSQRQPDFQIVNLDPALSIAQSIDVVAFDTENWRIETGKNTSFAQFSDVQKTDILLAWALVAHVKSNAIVLVKDGRLIGLGAGQVSRINAIDNAIRQAKKFAKLYQNPVLASDAFLPFCDSVDASIAIGVWCIIQPGGGGQHDAVVEHAKNNNITMISTHRRHFYH